MKTSSLASLLGALVPALAAPNGLTRQADPPYFVEGKYIVQLKPGTSPDAVTSPARVPEAFTVGMTQADRARVNEGSFGSSYGPELDVFAPAHDIVSASNLSDTASQSMKGTSMAAPLVAGLVCYLRGLTGGFGTPKEVTDRILELAVPDVVTDPKGSPNLLVNNGSGR